MMRLFRKINRFIYTMDGQPPWWALLIFILIPLVLGAIVISENLGMIQYHHAGEETWKRARQSTAN